MVKNKKVTLSLLKDRKFKQHKNNKNLWIKYFDSKDGCDLCIYKYDYKEKKLYGESYSSVGFRGLPLTTFEMNENDAYWEIKYNTPIDD